MGLRIAEEASLTDVGRQRNTNEDAFFESSPVFAVADGMGGAQAGEVASALAVEEFSNDQDGAGSPEEQLRAIIRAANRRIWDMAQADQRRAGMGTTLTAVIIGDDDIAVGHVGDSRLYLFRDKSLEQVTRDHSLVEEFVRQGKLTREQAERHPQRSVITRALGPESDVDVETMTVPGRDGDVLLLCSDGLSGMVPDDQMESILRESATLDDAAKGLIDTANANGGKDNITVVLIRLADDAGQTDADATIAGQERAPSAEEVEQARATASRASPDAAPAPEARSRPRPAAPQRGLHIERAARSSSSRRGRAALGILLALVLLAGVAIGLYAASRQVWFLGTNDDGAVTLYRGVPYELPLGVELYEARYVSGVPAARLPAARRERVLDHQLRSRDDAEDLIRRLDVAAAR